MAGNFELTVARTLHIYRTIDLALLGAKLWFGIR